MNTQHEPTDNAMRAAGWIKGEDAGYTSVDWCRDSAGRGSYSLRKSGGKWVKSYVVDQIAVSTSIHDTLAEAARLQL